MNSPTPRTPQRQRIDPNRSKGTPRRHKTPNRNRKPGIKDPKKSLEQLTKELKEKLKLTFTPEDWQAQVIQKVSQGYDSIICAGTGYGKSLIFEGLAATGARGEGDYSDQPPESTSKRSGKQSQPMLHNELNLL